MGIATFFAMPLLLFFQLLFCQMQLPSGDDSLVAAVLYLCGADDISQVNQNDYAVYEHYAAHRLPVNRYSRAGLLSSGLFSAYQAESILDYRQRNGQILSAAELAVVDGFTPEMVQHLRLFLDFSASGDVTLVTHADGEAVASLQAKMASDDWTFKWAAKARSGIYTPRGDWGLSFGARSDWSQPVIKNDTLMWKQPYAGAGDFAYSVDYNAGGSTGVGFGGGGRWLSRVVLGHFNARLGQGLCQWSGVVIDSYSTPASLMKKPSYVSPYRGWSPESAMYGAATRMDFGRVSIVAFADIGGINYAAIGADTSAGKGSAAKPVVDTSAMRFGGSVAWNHRNGSVGLNAVGGLAGLDASVDFQQTCRGVVSYGEAHYHQPLWAGSGAPASGNGAVSLQPGSLDAVAGVRGSIGPVDAGLRLGYGPYLHNVNTALAWTAYGRNVTHKLDWGVQGSYASAAKGQTPHGGWQIKSQANYSAVLHERLTFATRVNVKLRGLSSYADSTAKYAAAWPARRYELRQDLKWDNGVWLASLRLNALYGDTLAMLGALETGWRSGTSAASGPAPDRPRRISGFAYLQAALFRVDDWDDRLYLYQRDAPGSFNVPAIYGRGYMISAYAGATIGRYVKLFLRGSWSSYPWARPTDTRKTNSAEAKLQLTLSF